MLLELQNLEVVYHESVRAVQGISITVLWSSTFCRSVRTIMAISS